VGYNQPEIKGSIRVMKEFVNFIREQGIVGLAIGLAIGAKAGDAVSAIVENFINPLVGILLQGTTLTDIESKIKIGKADTVVFGWGNILQALIVLVATAFVVYFIVQKAGLTKADKKK
jgi:large conductance mechanosensitive channel protein